MPHRLFDSFSTEYKTPFGAVKLDEKCTFTLRLPKALLLEQPTLVLFRPGFKERYLTMEFARADIAFNYYSCEYHAGNVGLHHYYFTAVQHGNRVVIKRKGANEGSFEGTELFQLTVYDPNYETPDWIKGGMLYQIFPDRFYKSQNADHGMTPMGRELHDSWFETPAWRPNREGVITNNDYFGGDLKGIEEKLPYLKSLGVTAVYLCPIFESHENHRYSTANYENVDPMLGTESDFVSLCAEAKKLGIGIILDGVFSHTGADSIYFNKFGRYGDCKGAFKDPNSPYREWYSFTNYPNEYESWWGITTLPNVKETTPSYTEYICGDDGIIKKWLKLGASGWRLDVADELPDEFIDNINKAVKSCGEDKILYGEVWEDASNKESYGVRRRYLIGNQLDSVMNYPFKEIILNYIKTSDPKPFYDGVMTIIEHYPKPSVDVLMNFLSTHDTERAITRLAGDDLGGNNREWQSDHTLSAEQYVYGVTLLKCAMVLQFFLPGIPCVYYGDEAGQEGYKDPFNRRTYPWTMENCELVDFVRELGEIRKQSRVFEKGGLHLPLVDNNTCIIVRYDYSLNEAVAVFLNKSKRGQRYSISTAQTNFKSFSILRSSHGEREPGAINVAPFDYAVVKYLFNPLEGTDE